MLDTAEAIAHWKADGLDLTPMLRPPPVTGRDAAASVRASRTTGWTPRWTTR